ncbi:MAG TPA: hypothetical protein VFH95_05765 [Candidatus Kapabacteria bacterium]|nr:hypothetical protein [Candidatus Kapabacteria bacterium]
MRSFRSWVVGLVLGAALFCGVPPAKAQVPRGITYQGMVEQNGAPFNGTDSMTFIFLDKSGNVLFTQIDPGVIVTNGIFIVVLGPFPESMTFNEQYSMEIVVTSNGSSTTLPPQLLWSAPYAFNAERVNGLDVSATPVSGDIFPMPLNASGKIDSSMLPLISAGMLASNFVQTISGIAPNATTGDFQIIGDSGITITPTTNGITINASGGGGITSISGTNGITGGGTDGNIVLGIGAGAITSNMLNPNIGIQTLAAQNGSSTSPSIIALDSETNGNAALMVQGGIGANNTGNTPDSSGLNAASHQSYWADEVSVPPVTTTSLAVYNKLVGAYSTIIVTPVGIAASGGGLTITSQAAGTFTVTSKDNMGTANGGKLTDLYYMVVNH